MKKYLTILTITLTLTFVQSQVLTDALRYAQDNLNGTARFSAMSGAFGALGGDFSAINVNPAGSAIFVNNQASFTLSNYNIKNKSAYFGSKNSESNVTFDINQAGAILVLNNSNTISSDWKKIVLAINYENANNFDNSLLSFGTNPNNSGTAYFASVANSNSIPLDVLQVPSNTEEYLYYSQLPLRDQIAFLGYQGYLINPLSNNGNNTAYQSNVSPGNFYQKSLSESTGYNGKVTFNSAVQYKERLYIGVNINTHFTDYRKTTGFYEENDNNQTNGVRDFYYETGVHTYGNGFSFQMGTIAKINKSLRAGLSYESPTWYELTDDLVQTLSSSGFNYGIPANPNLTEATPDTNVLITYQPYKLKTPGKWTGSLAYVFAKTGLLSIDYSLKDYTNTKFRPNDSYFNPINNEISNNLTTAGELRIGGEYRIKKLSLRGGFRNQQSPYKNNKTVGDLNGFSGGFGYNFGKTKLDLSYAYNQRKNQQGFFSQGFTDSSTVTIQNNNISMTLLFEL